MRLDAYQQQAGRTDPHPQGSRDGMANHALGLAGETGELVDHVKKHLFHGHPLDRQRAAKELGDVLWYVARMAWCLGFGLSEVAALNLHKIQERYPDGFSAERSRNRPENASELPQVPRSGACHGGSSGPDPIADSAGSQAARMEEDR